MNIASIPRPFGAAHRRKRLGRGIGSGHGKTSTRGQKGQRARTGSRKRPGFEGGATPLIRKLPKRGFRRKATGQAPPAQIVNVEQLNALSAEARITPATLKAAGLIRHEQERVKLLGNGAVTKRLTVAVHAASESARAKISQAGGTVELLPTTQTRGAHVQATERAR